MNEKDPKTAGIAPAQTGALAVLQFTPCGPVEFDVASAVFNAARARSRRTTTSRTTRRSAWPSSRRASRSSSWLIVANVPAGPERSTAISRAREAKYWASGGVALEGR